MQNVRTHYFPANDCNIITGLCPNGEYGAYREQDDGRVRGYGHSRLAAIADLNEAIEVEGSIYEREPRADDPEVATDMAVNQLMSATKELFERAASKANSHLVRREANDIELAYTRLGRLLSQIRQTPTAAL